MSEECKKAVSERMTLNNPMRNPEVAKRVGATQRANNQLRGPRSRPLSPEMHDKMSILMKERTKSPGFPRPVMSEDARLAHSERMTKNNPMKNPEVAKRNGELYKQKKLDGRLQLIDGKWRKATPLEVSPEVALINNT